MVADVVFGGGVVVVVVLRCSNWEGLEEMTGEDFVKARIRGDAQSHSYTLAAMAGMLPGVECARRRRVHQSSESPNPANTNGCTRRSSFCLYASNNETHQTSTFSLQRSKLNQASYMDEKLGVEARVAKERLDERLRTQRKTQPNRLNRKEGSLRSSSVDDGRSTMIIRDLHREVYGSKKTTTKTGSRKFSWAKLSWKSSDQDECAVCLERFMPGETLVHLPCAHRFHSGCMVPWLEKNAHCPCCRTGVALVSQ
ncbi:hypothetical protein ACLB2K_009100 [Fragaria x ananassa]